MGMGKVAPKGGAVSGGEDSRLVAVLHTILDRDRQVIVTMSEVLVEGSGLPMEPLVDPIDCVEE